MRKLPSPNTVRWPKLLVQGHTDSIGSDVGNLRLSKRRAAGVKNALIEHYNIDPRRLTTEGYGRTPQGRGELM